MKIYNNQHFICEVNYGGNRIINIEQSAPIIRYKAKGRDLTDNEYKALGAGTDGRWTWREVGSPNDP